ncbi:MAG: AAA family ATPase, partial [Candidatus Binatia bacterium]
LVRTCLRAVDDRMLRQLVGPHGSELTALLAPLRSPRPDGLPASESPAARFRLFNAIAHFLDAYAQAAPLVMILDDLHWADPSSLLLLRFFTQEQRQRRILMIGLYRAPGVPPNRALAETLIEASREPGTERMTLGSFSPAETAALLTAALGGQSDAGLADDLQQWTGGNPLFLTECLRQLSGAAAPAGQLPLPTELRVMIEQRLDGLSVADRQVLRLAGTLGADFHPDALLALLHEADATPADTGREQPAAAIGAAEQLGLLRPGAQPGGYSFAHGVVRAVLCGELPMPRRGATPRPPAAEPPALVVPGASAGGPRADTPSVFRKEGEYWTIEFAATTCRIRDTKGLAYIALLLRHPGKSLHVSELVHLGDAAGASDRGARDDPSAPARLGLGDAGVVLDAQAKAEYRRRLAELQAELEEAVSFRDTGRAERARREIDFLSQELTAAVGLGGRDRRAGSDVERARINVTRSIARALEKLDPNHPVLVGYLSRTIKTGTFCVYTPDATVAADWEL